MKNSKKSRNATVAVGIIGCDAGVGVTHLSIMLAGFISSKKRRKTAVVELNDSGAFDSMGVLCCGENYNKYIEMPAFQIAGVDYYCGITVQQYAQLFQLGYEYIVIDMGHLWKENYYEFLRCNNKIMVGNCNEWNVLKFEECIKASIEMGLKDNIQFLSIFGNTKLQRQLRRQYRVDIENVPFIKTPFELNQDSFAFFDKLVD